MIFSKVFYYNIIVIELYYFYIKIRGIRVHEKKEYEKVNF